MFTTREKQYIVISVGNMRVRCRVIGHRAWFDTEVIKKGEQLATLFSSMAGKERWQADFCGDMALVKEYEYALISGYETFVTPRNATVSYALVDARDQELIKGFMEKGTGITTYFSNPTIIAGGRGVGFRFWLSSKATRKTTVRGALYGLHLLPVARMR